MQRFLVILGLILLALGVLWPWIGRLGLGRLPGDVYWRSGSITVYVPLTTSLLLSALLSLLLWWLSR
jgi:multisubunit Na+/H+ antiporter MnhG subunit